MAEQENPMKQKLKRQKNSRQAKKSPLAHGDFGVILDRVSTIKMAQTDASHKYLISISAPSLALGLHPSVTPSD